MSERVVACVIARVESQRLPRKVLADIQGQAMLKRLIDRIRTCEGVDDIVLCTADTPPNQALISRASDWGVHAYAGSENDVLDRVIQGAGRLQADHVIRITGDNVLTDPFYLSRLIEEYLRHGAAYGRVNNLPLGMTAELLSLDMARSLHSELKDPNETEYLLFYAFRPERHTCVVLEPMDRHKRPTYSLTVDTSRDLELVRSLFAAFPQSPAGPDIDEIIGWLDSNERDRIELAPEAPIRMPRGASISFGELLAELDRRAASSLRVKAD